MNEETNKAPSLFTPPSKCMSEKNRDDENGGVVRYIGDIQNIYPSRLTPVFLLFFAKYFDFLIKKNLTGYHRVQPVKLNSAFALITMKWSTNP